ncbi:RrF2 family transcriptional regulator [Thermodesulfobacteriota bacterium]
MKLSTRSHYGLRMMVDLAQNYQNGPLSITDIAKSQNISSKYLEQIIIPLKKAKYVESVRGPKGGHLLAKPPEKVSVGEIIDLLEKTMDITVCEKNPDKCNRSKLCMIRGVLFEANKAMLDKLNSITLSDVVEVA